MDSIDDPSPSASAAVKKPFLLPRSLTYHRRSRDASRPFWKNPADDHPKHSIADSSVVVYTTSLRGIRRTHEDCCAVRAILRGFHVAVDERDVSMDAAYRGELQGLIVSKGKPASLPQVFVRGCHIGGAEEVRQLHEAGAMGRLLEGIPRQDPAFVCVGCGGIRFVPCGHCSGSRKVFVEEDGRMRRCEDCNENGLESVGMFHCLLGGYLGGYGMRIILARYLLPPPPRSFPPFSSSIKWVFLKVKDYDDQIARICKDPVWMAFTTTG